MNRIVYANHGRGADPCPGSGERVTIDRIVYGRTAGDEPWEGAVCPHCRKAQNTETAVMGSCDCLGTHHGVNCTTRGHHAPHVAHECDAADATDKTCPLFPAQATA